MRKSRLSKEEELILNKYKKYTCFEDALSIPLEYWDSFEKLESIHQTYYELFQTYYEDLKYYALMYRDVYLFDRISFLDMHFFAQRKKEVIGFKECIHTKKTLKSQVVQIYYDNEPMFGDFCSKFLKIEKWSKHSRRESYVYKNFLEIRDSNRFDRFCVDKLTDEQCKIIIANKNEIVSSQPSLCSLDLSMQTPKDFVEHFYMPCMVSKEIKYDLYRKNISEYVKPKISDSIFSDFEISLKEEVFQALHLRKQYYFTNHIFYKGDDVDTLEKSKPELESHPLRQPKVRLHNYISWELIGGPSSYEEYCELVRMGELEEENLYKERCRKIDQENKRKIDLIENINKQIDNLKRRKKEELISEYNSIICHITDTLFSKDSIWKYIYEHQDDINIYLRQVYTEHFKQLWYKDSDSCRAYFKYHRNYGLVEKFLELEGLNQRYTNSDEYKIFCNKPYEHECVDRWISSVKKHVEEIEKKERDEAERKTKLERIEHEKRLEKFRFNERNAHVRDYNIKLRHYDHVYIVNGVALDSVTTFVDNAFPKFDAAYHAKRKAEQLGVSIKEVLEMWEKKGQESRDLGTAMHANIENYYLGKDTKETAEYKLFKTFASKIQLKPYRTEWAVYDWEHKIAGTIDFVDYQNGEYVIYDWKRSDKIVENGIPVKTNKYGEKGKNPLEHLDNTPYYHYALQLSLYKYILEKNYGLKIADLRLGIFHPTYNKPYVLRMPYLEKEVNDIIALRSEILF